jgi:required for meiotic nuclear division protein 1
MRCVAFCTADSYRLGPIATFYKAKSYGTKQYRKLLHITIPKSDKEIFIFSYGCLVTWGLHRTEELALVKELEAFAVKPLSPIESDYFSFKYANNTEMVTHERFNADMILLESDSSAIKLAISYGLTKSIQLESYETAVQKIIEKNQPSFTDLAKKGTIALPRGEIPKRLGEIFVARSQINLNSEYLEAPEYFWEHPSLENYYNITEKFFDVRRRVAALNQKLNVLHELFEILTTQLQSRHSNFLEWIIILLILVEIILSLLFSAAKLL